MSEKEIDEWISRINDEVTGMLEELDLVTRGRWAGHVQRTQDLGDLGRFRRENQEIED